MGTPISGGSWPPTSSSSTTCDIVANCTANTTPAQQGPRIAKGSLPHSNSRCFRAPKAIAEEDFICGDSLSPSPPSNSPPKLSTFTDMAPAIKSGSANGLAEPCTDASSLPEQGSLPTAPVQTSCPQAGRASDESTKKSKKRKVDRATSIEFKELIPSVTTPPPRDGSSASPFGLVGSTTPTQGDRGELLCDQPVCQTKKRPQRPATLTSAMPDKCLTDPDLYSTKAVLMPNDSNTCCANDVCANDNSRFILTKSDKLRTNCKQPSCDDADKVSTKPPTCAAVASALTPAQSSALDNSQNVDETTSVVDRIAPPAKVSASALHTSAITAGKGFKVPTSDDTIPRGLQAKSDEKRTKMRGCFENTQSMEKLDGATPACGMDVEAGGVTCKEQYSQTYQQQQCQKECQTDSAQCQKECQTDDEPSIPLLNEPSRIDEGGGNNKPIQAIPPFPRPINVDVCIGRPFAPVKSTSFHQRSCSTDHNSCSNTRYSDKYSRQRRQQSSDYLYFYKKAADAEAGGRGPPPPPRSVDFLQNFHPKYKQQFQQGGVGGDHKKVEVQFSDPGVVGNYEVEFFHHKPRYSAVEVVTAEVMVVGSSSLQDAPMVVPSSPPDESPPPKKRWSFSSGIGEASLYHALVVIFLEFFAWGLLTSPMIDVLNETFPDHTFLMNGLIVGIKGILSFLSAPLIGALSDVWGRKFFLLVTVFFTCLPIPFMKINTWWYFALISMSGVFAVTFSIVFAYVADVTDEDERSYAYGLVSATFAASLVTSPALGAYLGSVHSDDLVVGLATAIAVLDVFFILVAVPESLPEKLRLSSSWSAANISWENADPFSALWKVSSDRKILLISMTVLLSYLPEAGQYSCFFVYLRLVMGFNAEMVATFIAAVGILSVVAQTAVLALLMRNLSCKKVIIIGLVFEMLQLMWYGFGSQAWMMWAAGLLASISSITYPAISAYVSMHTDADKQGVVQGIVTGVRGLCSGLGPAMFGFIFYIFHVDLSESSGDRRLSAPPHSPNMTTVSRELSVSPNLVPGPPFVFGSLMVIVALLVAAFIPEGNGSSSSLAAKARRQSGGSSNVDLGYERSHKKNDSLDAASLPLMDESGVL